MPRLLVVDDDPMILYALERGLQSHGLEVVGAATGQQALELVGHCHPDAVILDVALPDMSGMELFDRLREIDPRLPVVFVTAASSTGTAIEAMKRGAVDYLLKPVDMYRLRAAVSRAAGVGGLRRLPAALDEGACPPDRALDLIVGRSPAMQEVYKAVGRVAPQDMGVLILGESGTGKELVARALHHYSRRSAGPFLAINCAAIPESLLESELFGHERGAFTGADQRRIGKFEQADHGTLFLDEIGDMTPATQPKILRVLQEQQFARVGGNEFIHTDVRVIAATNQDLEKRVAVGQLRQDLYYRLKVFTIQLPPLRERAEDLPLLVAHFLKQLSSGLGKQVSALAPETMQVLQAHAWPGNVRELQSALKYALVHAVGDMVMPADLPESVRTPAPRPALPAPEPGALDIGRLVGALLRAGEEEIYRKVSDAADRVVIETVLRHVKGNQVQASQLLGISRTTLRAKLRSLGVAVEKQPLSTSAHRDASV